MGVPACLPAQYPLFPFMRRPVFDPQQLPVMPSEASLPALGAERLTAEFVRDRLRTPPDWEPEHTDAVSYTHLTLPTNTVTCRSRWSPYH